jgi:hypothetical protein
LAPQKIQTPKFRWESSRLDFWDQDCILLIDYLPNSQTINTEYYSSRLVQLKNILKEKRPREFHQSFLHDNAPAHPALATQM